MNVPAVGIGGLIALVVLVLAIVFVVTGELALVTGCLIGALAVARLT
jgi:hypothetical protein